MEQDCAAAAHQQHAISLLACGSRGGKQQQRRAARARGKPFLKCSISIFLRLNVSSLCTSSDNIALASQKEHGGRGKACMRALQAPFMGREPLGLPVS
eukprot:1159065-Pelagomonas_calceolata.AAC.8